MADAKSFAMKEPYFAEVTNGEIGHAFHYTQVLFDKVSPFQHVQVFQTPKYGKMMMIDGYAMTSEVDEFVYHEALAHIPALGHPAPRRALIIGGGDGGTARELIRHPEIERVVLVDIDPEVINAARQCLPELAKGLDHPKTEVRIEDAIRYVAECKEPFDIICIDSTEPVGPGVGLISPEFYTNCKRLLTPNGILVSQTMAPLIQADDIRLNYKNLRQVFPLVASYGAPMVVYPGGYWSFAWASVSNAPMKYFNRARAEALCQPLRWLNADLYPATFVLPTFMLRLIEGP